METRIKERLTGALILVAVMVILVPELFSGGAGRTPSDAVPVAGPATEGPPLVTYRMPLDGSAEAEAATGQAALNVQTPEAADRLPPPRPTAPPDAEPAAPTQPAEVTPPPQQAPAAPPPAPVAEPAPKANAKAAPATDKKPAAEKKAEDKKPPAADKDKGWFVQLGVFSKRENAEQLVKQVGKKEHGARVLGSSPPFRVRVGPVRDRAAAQALRKRLAADGFNGTVVAP